MQKLMSDVSCGTSSFWLRFTADALYSLSSWCEFSAKASLLNLSRTAAAVHSYVDYVLEDELAGN